MGGELGFEAGLRRVARLGDGWMASAYNTDPDLFAAGLGIIADERTRLGRRPAEVPSTLATMWTWVTESGPDADRVLADVLAPMIGRSPEQLRGRVCVGSAKQCAELLSRYARQAADGCTSGRSVRRNASSSCSLSACFRTWAVMLTATRGRVTAVRTAS